MQTESAQHACTSPPGSAALRAAWLVCGNVYPLFDPKLNMPAGGMETRAALFGRGLAATGRWHVSFVVSDFGQPFVTHHEGIDFLIYQPVYRHAGRNVFPRLRRRGGAPLLRLDWSDLHLCWQIPLIAAWLTLPAFFFPRFWRRLKPAVVCCFGNNERSAEVIADCRRAGIRTILCIASDKDLAADYRPGNHERNHYGMPKWKGYYSLAHADCIVVQSATQRKVLQRHFDRDAVLIRNPVHAAADDPQRWLLRKDRDYVIWIGRTDSYNKRPMLFLELARHCPALAFVMVVSRTDKTQFAALELNRPPNLRILENLSPDEVQDCLRHAKLFVNTSQFEGFPNTFLQSAVMGVPIVSLAVDPDGMLAGDGCGLCAGENVDLLGEYVQRLWHDDDYAEQLARACHRYVLECHAAPARISEFAACLEAQGNLGGRQNRTRWWQKLRRFAGNPKMGRPIKL